MAACLDASTAFSSVRDELAAEEPELLPGLPWDAAVSVPREQ